MRHARFDVAELRVEGVGVPIRAASLVVAQSDDGEYPHWECVAYAVDPVEIARGSYRVEMTTLDGRPSRATRCWCDRWMGRTCSAAQDLCRAWMRTSCRDWIRADHVDRG